RLPGRDARIVPAAHAHHRRVLHALLHVLDAVHLVERRRFGGVLHGAELRRVRRTVGAELHAHRIRAADGADGRAAQIGPLGDRAADQDPARAGAGARQLARAGVALLRQVLGAGDEVLPGVGLGLLVPGLAPGFTLLRAAARVAIGHHHVVQRQRV